MPLPSWFLDRPELLDGDEFYIKAFWELSTGRQIGFSLGPIPWDQILLYAQMHGIDDIEAFVEIIRALDSTHLTWVADQQERERKRSAAPAGPTPPSTRQRSRR